MFPWCISGGLTRVYASLVYIPVYMPPPWFKAGFDKKVRKGRQNREKRENKVDKCAKLGEV